MKSIGNPKSNHVFLNILEAKNIERIPGGLYDVHQKEVERNDFVTCLLNPAANLALNSIRCLLYHAQLDEHDVG